MLACVDAMLANSKLIKGVRKRHSSARSREYWLSLRNPPSERVTFLGFAAHSPRDGTKRFVVEFTWPGPWMGGAGGMQPPPDPGVTEGQGEMLRDLGARLLQDVRAECAPNTPGEPACIRVNQGRGGQCTLGGK